MGWGFSYYTVSRELRTWYQDGFIGIYLGALKDVEHEEILKTQKTIEKEKKEAKYIFCYLTIEEN